MPIEPVASIIHKIRALSPTVLTQFLKKNSEFREILILFIFYFIYVDFI